MARLFLLLIFILNLSIAAAGNFDSLLRASLRFHADTEKVTLFYREGFANRIMQPAYALRCARQAHRIALQSKSLFHLGKAENLLGVLFYRKRDLPAALRFHRKALEHRIQAKDREGAAMSHINLGNIFSDLKKFALAEKAYLQALQLLNENGSKKQLGNCLINLGVLNAVLEKYGAAKNYFLDALKNAKERFDYEQEAICLNNLSEIYLDLGQPEEAIASANNSIKIKDLMDNEVEKADSYLSLSRIYLRKADVAEAEHMLATADSIIARYDYFDGRMEALKLRAELCKEKKDFEMAYFFLQRYQRLNDSLQKANALIDEEPIEEEEVVTEAAQHEGGFSLFYFNLILIPCMAAAAFILSLKR